MAKRKRKVKKTVAADELVQVNFTVENRYRERIRMDAKKSELSMGEWMESMLDGVFGWDEKF